MFWFSVQFLSEKFLVIRRNERDVMKNVCWCSCKVLEFSWQIFEKSSNIKFHENSSSGSRDVPCGRTDRHDEADSRYSQLVNAPKTRQYHTCTPVPVRTVKAYVGHRRTVPRALHLHKRYTSVVHFTLRPLYLQFKNSGVHWIKSSVELHWLCVHGNMQWPANGPPSVR